MIVKVQLSVATTEDTRQVLCYNQSRSVQFEGPADAALVKTLKGALKSYWHAQMIGPRNDRRISLGDPAPEQEW